MASPRSPSGRGRIHHIFAHLLVGHAILVPTDDPVTFNIEIVNPCVSATITDLVFTPAALTVEFGHTIFTEWAEPTTSVDVTHASLGGFCGPIKYEIFTDADGTDTLLTDVYSADWATISEP